MRQIDFELTIYGYEKDDISAEIEDGLPDDSHYKNHTPLPIENDTKLEAVMYRDSLIINAKKLFSQEEVQSARLEVSYWPDHRQQGKKVTTNFFLDD
ncbi:hypothetical protein [Kangiella shandongensis]|uniref:hypothetical protein n=1 Tax=Kangiella shandongensis TaxID=2763258 RepID=UPI001CC05D65|nr:hypothetical protein [Kangiella shandongensis]